MDNVITINSVVNRPDKFGTMSRYCPYCNGKLNYSGKNKVDSGGGFSLVYGSPIVICPKCSRESLDRNIHEIAVEGISENEYNVKERIKLAFLFLAIGLLSSALLIYEVKFLGYYHVVLVGATLAFLLLFVLMLGYSLHILSGGRANTIEKLRQQSVMRLQNKEYAHKLKYVGYSVPNEFLM